MDILNWFSSPSGLNWLKALTHSLWIGAITSVMTACILRSLPTSVARLRHNIILCAQILILLSVWAFSSTPISNTNQQRSAPESLSATVTANNKTPTEPVPQISSQSNSAPNQIQSNQTADSIDNSLTVRIRLQALAGILWCLGSGLILCLRIQQSITTYRWTKSCKTVTARLWKELLKEETERLNIRPKVRLLSAKVLTSPVAYGLLHLSIIIPETLLNKASIPVIRAILAHELSHLKRFDPLIVAFQQVIEAVLFFNPFIWILSQWSQREREADCDQSATSSTANRMSPLKYGELLLSLTREPEQRPRSGNFLVHQRAPKQLKERIIRLIHPEQSIHRRVPIRLSLTSILAALTLLTGTQQATIYATEALSHAQWIQRIQDAAGAPEYDFTVTSHEAVYSLHTTALTPNGDPISAVIAAVSTRVDSSGRHTQSTRYNTDAVDSKIWKLPILSQFQGRPTKLESITFYAFADGFSPSEVSIPHVPITTGSQSVALKLKEPIEAIIEVIDSEGRAIPGATVSYRYEKPIIDANSSFHSNEQGIIQWNAPEDTPLTLNISAKGFLNRQQKNVRFTKEANSLQITLTAGTALRGRVINKATGRGVSGASINYIMSEGEAFRSGSSWHRPKTLTQSDANGDFTTYALQPDVHHWIVAKAPGYLAAFNGNQDGRSLSTFDEQSAVVPGSNQPAQFELLPKEPLELEIIPPEGVELDEFRFRIWSSTYVKGEHTSPNPWIEPVKILHREDLKQPQRIRLTIEPQVLAPIQVHAYHPESLERDFLNWKSGDTLLADFRTPTESSDETRLTIHLDLPKGTANPDGEVVIQWQKGPHHFDNQAFPVQGRQVKAIIQDRVPDSPIYVYPLGMIGYYFPPTTIQDQEHDQMIEITISPTEPAGAIQLNFPEAAKTSDREVRLLLPPMPPNQTPSSTHETDEKVRHSSNYMTIEVPVANSRITRPNSPMGYPFRPAKEKKTLLITPVPLNQAIRLEIREASKWIIIDPITLSPDHALQKIKVEAPECITFSGTLFDAQETPIEGREIDLIFYPKRNPGLPINGYVQKTTTNIAGQFTFNELNPNAQGTYTLELKTERGHKEIGSNIDIRKSFTYYLDRTYTIHVTVSKDGTPLNGEILKYACLFAGSQYGPSSGNHLLDRNGQTDLKLKEPLVDLFLTMKINGHTYQKKLSLQNYKRDEFPISIDFNLDDKTRIE